MKEDNQNKLYNYIRGLDDFLIHKKKISTYNHIGATIIDAILQAGLNYRNVVFPRVRNFINKFPEQRTTRDFHAILKNYDIHELISWKGSIKIVRIYELKDFFLKQKIITEDDLIVWLTDPNHETLLYQVKGIGLKTVDYLKMLVGIQTIAIDRHLRNFVSNAGLLIKSYDKIKSILMATSKKLEIDPVSLDYSIWTYMNKRPNQMVQQLPNDL